MAHLARYSYGITETDIQAKSFKADSGSACALRAARFITTLDALHLRFQFSGANSARDTTALSGLVRRLPPIKSIDLESYPISRPRKLDILECLLLELIPDRSRPVITVSPPFVSITRPYKPTLYAVRRLFRRGTEPTIDDENLSKAFTILPIMRMGGTVPRLSIRVFEPPSPISSLILIWDARVFCLRFPDVLRLSPAELAALLTHLNLSLVRDIEIAPPAISESALHSFFCRHPTLEILRLRDRPPKEHPAPAPPPPLPSDALPKLEHVLGGARLLAWVLASPQPSPCLVVVTLELHDLPGARDNYRTALRGLAQRPTADTLALQFKGWAPWKAPDFAAPAASGRALQHVIDLRLTFRFPTIVPQGTVLLEWLRLFPGLQQVMLFNFMPLPIQKLGEFLRVELPHLNITAHVLTKTA
ncbi:hypothetical protein K438DRAFT_1823603 [Mycena galopus ATCC 62051]|nr:hypothetical protein K438DRAFT_1823603 [Mycena galopus ATCC 62051]